MLARGRVAGLAAFENTLPVAAFSFRAAAICLPIFLFLKDQSSAPVDVALSLVVDLLVFVASWAGFALASLYLAKAIGVAEAWPRFIAAWNWSAAVQYLALAALSLPGALLGNGTLLDLGGLLALFYALWLERGYQDGEQRNSRIKKLFSEERINLFITQATISAITVPNRYKNIITIPCKLIKPK